jgi:hypothetical protein
VRLSLKYRGPEGQARLEDQRVFKEMVAFGFSEADASDEVLRRERSRQHGQVKRLTHRGVSPATGSPRTSAASDRSRGGTR